MKKKIEEKKETKTELVMILDESGSMYRLKEDTIGGYNDLISKQKKIKGICNVTTVLFNTKVHALCKSLDIKKVEELKDDDYNPGGCTALFDAVGQTIATLENKLKSDNSKDVKVIVAITTDGLENSSVEYDQHTIKTMIENKKEEGWDFLFLGANIDVVKEAAKIGIRKDKTISFMPTPKGARNSFRAMCTAFTETRTNKEIDLSQDDSEYNLK